MHEMALSESIRDIVEDYASRHGARRVRVVRLSVGALSCVEPEALAFCFDAVTRGTLAAGATLDIVVAPGEAWCWDCAKAFSTTIRAAVCPNCGGVRVRVDGGDALRVSELEID